MSSIIGRAHRILALRFARRASPLPARPLISFTFDDFPQSALHIGGDLLCAEGARGTYYAAFGMMGRDSSVGPIFTPQDLSILVASRHELACHTFGHLSSRAVPFLELRKDCEKNRTAAAELLGGLCMQNFSFPYGEVTLAAKRGLAETYGCCRSTEPGINEDPADIGFLRANPVYSHLPLERLNTLIRENALRNGWLIFYTHDVCSAPSKYGCTPAQFKQVLSWAKASGAELLTIAQALGRIQDSAHAESSIRA